ncbi:hypothetical protein [Nostoc sp. MG11]|uniref:hypothetical protein n=1 Tax=Nostoc sp. MG11 TaxID=2721166 RepID=UPI0018681B8E|nr:hypothetical protein [Nostoc sp. MG11]
MPNYIINIYLNNKLFSDDKYTFALNAGQIPVILFKELALVAKLHLKDVEEEHILDAAYYSTQTREKDWYKHPKVELLAAGDQRSTSVGDVFELHGHYWMIAPLGFVEIYPQK